jgi:hypothetical protein
MEYKGEQVRVKLEEAVLRGIADRTGGQYVGVGTGFVELDRWYGALVAGKAVRELKSSGRSPAFIHRFQLFLLPAVLLLLAEVVLRDARPADGPPRATGYFTWLGLRRRRLAPAPATEQKGSRS